MIPSQTPVTFYERSIFLAILLLLVSIQVGTINQQSFFMDEVEEIGFARGDFWTSVFMPDSMPPLFTVTLRSWLSIVGADSGARWLSCIFGVVSTYVTWRFSRQFMSVQAGLMATALFAFSPLQLYYAQLVRGYAMMTMWSCLSINAFLLATTTMRVRYWIGFTVCCVLGMYTHYYFIMIPMSLFLSWFAGCYRGFCSCDRGKPLILSSAVLVIAAMTLLMFLKIDFQYQTGLREPRPLSLAAAVYTYFSFFSGYALGPSQRELHANPNETFEALPWIMLTCAAALPLVVWALRRSHNRGLIICLCCLMTLPLVAIGMLGILMGVTYNVRFVCWMSFPLAMLLALSLDRSEIAGVPTNDLSWNSVRENRVQLLLLIVVLSVFGIANYQRVYSSRYQFEDTRGVAKFLKANKADEDTVFVVSDYMNAPLEYYLPTHAARMMELPVPNVRNVVLSDKASVVRALQVMLNETQDRYWFVYSRSFHGDPQGLLIKELKLRGLQFDRDFAGAQVYHGTKSGLSL